MSAIPRSPEQRTAIVLVPFGPPALGALAGAIRAARRGDPLGPVTVVPPSAHAGVSVRRHLARVAGSAGERGSVNVQWRSLDQVVDELVATPLVRQGARRLQGLERRALVRAVLAQAPRRWAAMAASATAERRVDAVLEELRDVDDAELDALAASNVHLSELVGLVRRYRRLMEPRLDRRALLDLAVAQLRPGSTGGHAPERLPPGAEALGHVILYLPHRLSRPQQRLAAALAQVGRLTVVLGETGDEGADGPTARLRRQLEAEVGAVAVRVVPRSDAVTDEDGPAPAVTAGSGSEVPGAEVRVLRAPDPDEEVRAAVRTVLDALAGGTDPHDVAVVYRVASPYALLVHEHLSAAGVPHHVPAVTTLRHSVPGRALSGFLGVAERGFRRAELFRWLRSAPIRTGTAPGSVSRFDRLSRQAGVAGGLDQWHQRLAQLRDDIDAAGAGGDDRARQAEVEDVDELEALIDRFAELAVPPARPTWARLARWATGLLDELVGTPSEVHAAEEGWPDDELQALDDVRTVLDQLGQLDRLSPDVDAARFRRVLDQELDRGTRWLGRFGHGVFVGSLDDVVGARHELVVILGMVEGSFPPPTVDDAVLPDESRRRTGVLVERRERRHDDQQALLAVLRAAPRAQLSMPRADTRAQAERVAARGLLDELGRMRGRYTGFDELDGLDHPAFVDVPSFEAGARAASLTLSEQEHAVARLLAGDAADEGLARGMAAIADRTEGRFSAWTGHVGPGTVVPFGDSRAGSPTSFEQWSTCPFRYFLSHVLDVRPLVDHAEADSIRLLDRGSLVHHVLELFVAENLGRSPDQPWTMDDHERLRSHLQAAAHRLEAAGRTGRPIIWQVELDRLARRFEQILEADTLERAARHVQPVDVELSFGMGVGGDPPVRIALDSGRVVAFRGTIDRVDRDPATGRLVVIDYKTGKDDGYRGIEKDITCGGRHLQLVIYAEAAQQRHGGDEVEAYYWFVEQTGARARRGGLVGPAERHRFREVLDIVVDGIEQGRFPANPGEAGFFGWRHCGFCDYDRVCPASRDDQWEAVRQAPELAGYRRLAGDGDDPGPAAVPPVPAAGDDPGPVAVPGAPAADVDGSRP